MVMMRPGGPDDRSKGVVQIPYTDTCTCACNWGKPHRTHTYKADKYRPTCCTVVLQFQVLFQSHNRHPFPWAHSRAGALPSLSSHTISNRFRDLRLSLSNRTNHDTDEAIGCGGEQWSTGMKLTRCDWTTPRKYCFSTAFHSYE